MFDVTIVVPCYNEAERLDAARVRELCAISGVHVLFVNDGSKDETSSLLHAFSRELGSEVLDLPANAGKGEAVRSGMLRAARRGDRLVGFADADFATPPSEIARVVRAVDEQDVDAVLGSRIAYAGANIERRPARHYAGRLFATISARMLQMRIYDTQCGAKVFRNTSSLRSALARPFVSRWIFDVELIGRLVREARAEQPSSELQLIELPLKEWRDVGGSRLDGRALVRVGLDVVRVKRSLDTYRRA